MLSDPGFGFNEGRTKGGDVRRIVQKSAEPAQGAGRSLCPVWTVRHIVAHLPAAEYKTKGELGEK